MTPHRELGQKNVQFATFPETVVPYYPYFAFVQTPHQILGGHDHLRWREGAIEVPSSSTHAIGHACRLAGLVASIGINERDGETPTSWRWGSPAISMRRSSR